MLLYSEVYGISIDDAIGKISEMLYAHEPIRKPPRFATVPEGGYSNTWL